MSEGNLKIDASELAFPPKVHEEPERPSTKPTSPRELGAEV